MSFLLAFTAQLLHMVLVLAAAPTLLGCIRSASARLARRGGPAILQPWHDLSRLSRKQVLLAGNASPLAIHAPLIGFSLTVTCAWLIPSFTLGMITAPLADLLLIAGLLALARCAMALAAMDEGTAPGGLAASQQLSLSCLLEPAALLVVLSLAALSGGANLDLIAGLQNAGMLLPGAPLTLAAAALAGVALSDMAGATAPLDREFSGPMLAMVQATEAVRLLIWLDLIGALFLPIGMAPAGSGVLDWLIGLVCWFGKLAIFALIIVALRMAIGSATPRRIQGVVGLAILLALLAGALALTSAGAT